MCSYSIISLVNNFQENPTDPVDIIILINLGHNLIISRITFGFLGFDLDRLIAVFENFLQDPAGFDAMKLFLEPIVIAHHGNDANYR